tara:strand:+ start:540 stop:1070 length:531 start_codon:yes stop_codon:yes gene_type:complete
MAITKLQSESLNLTDDFVFTGDVTADPIKLSPIVSVYMSGNQTIPDNSTTLLNYNSVDIDTDNAFTNTSGNYKFTVPSGKAGTYQITFLFNTFNENSTILNVQGRIYKNASILSYQRQRHDSGGSSRHSGTYTNWVGSLAVGDYIQAYGYMDISSDTAQVLGGSQQSRMTIIRLGN